MDFVLGRSALHQYTGDTLNFCYEELARMVEGRKGMLPEGTMPAERVAFYKDLVTKMQEAFRSVSESHELASSLIPKVAQKLTLFPKHKKKLLENGLGAAWILYAYQTHKKVKKGALEDNILKSFSSPFDERARSPSYGFFSPNPFGKFPLQDVRQRYDRELKSIESVQDEKAKAENAEYWAGLLKALEKALQPITSNEFCYHLHLLEVLLMLAQVPELAETLSKCHIASLFVFERLSEPRILNRQDQGAQQEPSLEQKPPIEAYMDSPLKTGHRRKSLLEGPSSIEKRVNALGVMLEEHINALPNSLKALEGRISDQVRGLEDALKAPLNQATLPQLQESLSQLDNLVKQIQQTQSNREEDSIPPLESIENVITKAFTKVSESHGSLLEALKAQGEALEAVKIDLEAVKAQVVPVGEEQNPLAARVVNLEVTIAEVNTNLLKVLDYLKQAKQRSEQENVNERMQGIEKSLADVTQQIGGLNFPADSNGPRFGNIHTLLTKILIDIGSLRAPQSAFVEIEEEEIQPEDPVLKRLTTIEELVKGLAESLKNVRPRQSNSSSSYQGQPNSQGRHEKERLVNHGNPPPADDTCCNIL